MEKKTNTQQKPTAAVKKMAAKPKTQAPEIRRFAFEHGLRQRVKSVTREGCTLRHSSGARFGSAMQQYAEECPSEREAAENFAGIAGEYVDNGYRELSGETYADYASGLRFSFTDEDLRGLFKEEGAPLSKDAEAERAAEILKAVYANTELDNCKKLELCFPGATLNALFTQWRGEPLEHLEALTLRVPESDAGNVGLSCGALGDIFPILKSLSLAGDAEWSLFNGSITALAELAVWGSTLALPSARFPSLTAVNLKLAQAVSLKSGEPFGLYEDWGMWCGELSAACPALQKLSVWFEFSETACEMLEELLRPKVLPYLADLRPDRYGTYNGDELCGVLARNMPRLRAFNRLTLQVQDSPDVAQLIRRLKAFPLPVYVEILSE